MPLTVACVASVSVWFRGKEIPRKGTFGFDRATFRAVFDSFPRSFLLNHTETRAKRATLTAHSDLMTGPLGSTSKNIETV